MAYQKKKKNALTPDGVKTAEEIARELARLRDRTGKKPLPLGERLQLLNEIYDGALYFLKQSLIVGQLRGTGALTDILQRARLEQTELQRCYDLSATATIDREPWGYAEWEPPLLTAPEAPTSLN